MLKGIDENGNIKNVRVSDKGSLFVKLVGSSGTDTSDATAVASDIIKGKTAYARGEKIIGTYEGGASGEYNTKAETDCSQKTSFLMSEMITELPELRNTEGITRLNNSFANMGISSIPELNLSNVEYINRTFTQCNNLQNVIFPAWNTHNAISFNGVFEACSNLRTVDLSRLDLENIKNLDNCFNNCTNLEEVIFGTKVPTSLQGLSNCFSSCTSLENISLSNFNSSNELLYLYEAFAYCTNLVNIDFGGLINSTCIKSMGGMIVGCETLSKKTLLDILQMCSNTTGAEWEEYEGPKTLQDIGFTQVQVALFTQEELQPVLNAGWTTGYEEQV